MFAYYDNIVVGYNGVGCVVMCILDSEAHVGVVTE